MGTEDKRGPGHAASVLACNYSFHEVCRQCNSETGINVAGDESKLTVYIKLRGTLRFTAIWANTV